MFNNFTMYFIDTDLIQDIVFYFMKICGSYRYIWLNVMLLFPHWKHDVKPFFPHLKLIIKNRQNILPVSHSYSQNSDLMHTIIIKN